MEKEACLRFCGSYGVAKEVKKKKMNDRVIRLVAFLWVTFACIASWVAATTLPAVPEIFAGDFGTAAPSVIAVLTISAIWIVGIIGTLGTERKEPILYSSLATLFLVINHCLVSMWPGLAGWTFWMLLVVSIVTLIGVNEALD